MSTLAIGEQDLSDSLSQLETVAALNSGPTVVNGPGLAHAGPGHNTARAAQSSSDDPESVQFRKPSSVTSFRRQSTDKVIIVTIRQAIDQSAISQSQCEQFSGAADFCSWLLLNIFIYFRIGKEFILIKVLGS